MSHRDTIHAKPERPACSPALEIGGYFELALPDFGDPFPAPFLKFQSARAALRAFLEASHFSRVMVPAYVCDSVTRAVVDAGRAIDFYALDDELLPPDCGTPLYEDVVLLYINYFGLCDDNLRRLQRRYPPAQLLIDNTQALFSDAGTACGVIYSPRKFFGVPDGGLLVSTGVDISSPVREDIGSLARMNHLLIRAASTDWEGYGQFLTASHSLEDTRPLRMSSLTQRLLASIDFHDVRQRRRANFERLSNALGHWNRRRWALGPDAVPLCYPLVLDGDVMQIRKRLASSSIYIPTFWEDARTRIATTGIEQTLLDRCFALPCDQRYTDEQMDILARSLNSELTQGPPDAGLRSSGNN